jgi:rubrerythrin
MLTEADKNQVSKAHSAEYAAYLQTLLDSAVFTNDMVTSELAVNAESDIEAMELAMGAEKDSILFYYGMKDIVPKRVQLTVDKIINEEKSHLRQLWELKKEMSAL